MRISTRARWSAYNNSVFLPFRARLESVQEPEVGNSVQLGCATHLNRPSVSREKTISVDYTTCVFIISRRRLLSQKYTRIVWYLSMQLLWGIHLTVQALSIRDAPRLLFLLDIVGSSKEFPEPRISL